MIGKEKIMIESYKEIKINNEDINLIIKQTIKLLYLVIEDNKRIQSELIALTDNASNISVNV